MNLLFDAFCGRIRKNKTSVRKCKSRSNARFSLFLLFFRSDNQVGKGNKVIHSYTQYHHSHICDKDSKKK